MDKIEKAPQVIAPVTRRMGYVCIEAERTGRRGGYTRMTFGTIDDVTDARAKGPLVESDRRSGKPPMPRAHRGNAELMRRSDDEDTNGAWMLPGHLRGKE